MKQQSILISPDITLMLRNTILHARFAVSQLLPKLKYSQIYLHT